MKIAALALLPVALFGAGAAYASDGCASGTTGTTYSPDGKAVSLLFSAFQAVVGDSAVCNLAVPAAIPAGTIAVYSTNYRGFANIADGQTSTLSVNSADVSEATTTTGPYTDDVTHSGRLGSGLNRSIDATIMLDVLPDGSDPGSSATLDTLDLQEIGRTTFASVDASIADLAAHEAQVALHLDTEASRLTGFLDPLLQHDGVEVEGAIGSATLGVKGNYNLMDGFSVQGGAAFVSEDNGGASVSGFPLVAGSLRYMSPDAMTFRPFGEAGLWGAPSLSMHFTRNYDGGTGSADVSGSIFSVYAKGGVLYQPTPDDQVVFSATLAQNWLNTGAYDETSSLGNLFAAHVPAGTTTAPSIRAGASWTKQVTPTIDVTASAAIGRTFGAAPITADVDWVGPVTAGIGDTTFVQIGARVGMKVSDTTTVSVFLIDTVGDHIAPHLQVGAAVRMGF